MYLTCFILFVEIIKGVMTESPCYTNNQALKNNPALCFVYYASSANFLIK